MVGVIKQLLTRQKPSSVQLLFANKQEKDIIWMDDFKQLAREFSW